MIVPVVAFVVTCPGTVVSLNMGADYILYKKSAQLTKVVLSDITAQKARPDGVTTKVPPTEREATDQRNLPGFGVCPEHGA